MKICKGRRDRGGERREKGTDRQMERGRDRVENRAEDTALSHSLALPSANRGGLCFPRGPALPALLFPFPSQLSSALLLALLWLPACTTVVLFTRVAFLAWDGGTLMQKAPDF